MNRLREIAAAALCLSLAMVAQGSEAPSASCIDVGGRWSEADQSGDAPAVRVSERERSIDLPLASRCADWVEVRVSLRPAAVDDGLGSNDVVAEDAAFFEQGETKTLGLPRPTAGFMPDAYRVDVEVDGRLEHVLHIDIVPVAAAEEAGSDASVAETGGSTATEPVAKHPRFGPASGSGLNIAQGALGGRIESRTSAADDDAFAAANLIDGRLSASIGGDVNFCSPCRWRAASKALPQELVFSFHEGREALVDAVVVDTHSLSPIAFNDDRSALIERVTVEPEAGRGSHDRVHTLALSLSNDSEGRAGDCEDTELLVPFGKIDKSGFKQTVRRIRALGTTPLAYSLTKAGEDLLGGDGERWIVLITDGKEECGGEPAEVVADLRAAGNRARIDVDGLALGDEQSKATVRRYADLSGGRFSDAQDQEALRNGIRETLAAPYEMLDATGEMVARGGIGTGSIKLPVGVFQVRVPTATGTSTLPAVEIERDRISRVYLHDAAGDVVGRIDPPVEP